MAKNRVTEDDLLAGVGGGFGGIAQMGTGRPMRDSPFRDTRGAAGRPAAQQGTRALATPPVEPERAEAQPAEPLNPVQPAPAAAPREVAAAQPAPAPQPVAQTAPPQQQQFAPRAAPSARPRPARKQRKTDIYPEKISTFLSPDMRDELEAAARLLHRNRLIKGDSITVHTLIRSGVRVLTELLEFTEADVVNSEEELDALVRRKLGR